MIRTSQTPAMIGLNSTRLSRRVDKLGGSRGREEEEEDEIEETLKLTTTLASDI